MIVRKRNINVEADEIQLAISYGKPDIKEWCRELYAKIACWPKVLAMTWSQEEIISYFSQNCFSEFQPKYRVQLARWATAAAIRAGYFVEDVILPRTYKLSEVLFESTKNNQEFTETLSSMAESRHDESEKLT